MVTEIGRSNGHGMEDRSCCRLALDDLHDLRKMDLYPVVADGHVRAQRIGRQGQVPVLRIAQVVVRLFQPGPIEIRTGISGITGKMNIETRVQYAVALQRSRRWRLPA